MFFIKRHMEDEDGDKMTGYLTNSGQYGTRKEAYGYSTYEEAHEDMQTEIGWFRQEFPNDYNDFNVVESD